MKIDRDKLSSPFSPMAMPAGDGGDGSEVRNPEGFWDMQKRLLGDFGSQALGLIDPGVELAAGMGQDLGSGNYGQAALKAPFLALNAAGLKGMKSFPGLDAKVKGMPESFKLPGGEQVPTDPIPDLMAARRDYMKSIGRNERALDTPPFSAEFAGRVGKEYDQMADDLDAPGVREGYQKLADETLAQYQALKGRGFDFRFMSKDADGNIVDPYAASPAMGYKDLRDNKRLEIFPTEGGFGSGAQASTDHPLLQPSGEMFGDQPALMNDIFRAVHDSYGHFGSGNAFFRAPGEDRAFGLHSTMYSDDALGAAASELRGQNSWLNYGPHPAAEANRTASGADTVFADQKTGVMPAWTYQQQRPVTVPFDAPFAGMPGSLAPEEEDRTSR